MNVETVSLCRIYEITNWDFERYTVLTENDQIICLDLLYGFQMSAGSGFTTDLMF